MNKNRARLAMEIIGAVYLDARTNGSSDDAKVAAQKAETIIFRLVLNALQAER